MPAPLLITLGASTIAAIMGALSRLFASRLGMWIAGAFAFLGIGLATNAFLVGPLLDEAELYVRNNLNAAGAIAIQWLKFLNFDEAVTMIFSAYAARLVVSAGKVYLAKRS